MISGYTAEHSLLQSRAFRRLLVASALGHLVATLILTFGSWRPLPSAELDVVYVSELPASALPSPSRAKPAPARQQVAEVVIPERPKPKPKPPAAKPPPAPQRPEPKPAAAQPTPPEPPPKETASASALLEKLRDEAAQRTQEGVADGQGTGARAGILDVEKAAYIRKVQAAVEPHWVSSACFRQQSAPLWTVEIAASGRASDIALGRSSGDRHCDDSAERAIHKAQPLPPPPAGIRVLDINFEELR